jgi:hypothetical protein
MTDSELRIAMIAVHTHGTQIYTEVMSDTQTVTIHLSSKERKLLRQVMNYAEYKNCFCDQG